MNRDDDRILAEAAQWHVAAGDDQMDWAGFTLWLEADPRHRAAYDEIALTDALLAEHPGLVATVGPQPRPAAATESNPGRGAWIRRARWAGVAFAAAVGAAIAIPQLVMPPPSQHIETGATPRRIALADGSSVLLAPRSQLTIDGRAQDRMALSGGALFDIRHDPARTLTIAAGSLSISDIGTRFDVQAEEQRVRVAVVQGAVEVAGEALTQPVRLGVGKELDFDGTAGSARLSAVAGEDVGGWQAGRLSYVDAPLALVVTDIARYAGVRAEVPAALRDRRFSGTLFIRDGVAPLRDLAQVMGLQLAGNPGSWRLEQPAR